VTDGLRHPGSDRRRTRILEKDVSNRAGVFIGKKHRLGALKNVERIGHVVGARNAGKIALDLRIAVQPFFLILLPGRERFRLIRDFPAFHHAHARGHGADRA